MTSIKKIITKIHRITGTILSVFFFFWFFSGFFMIFSGFPHAPTEDNFSALKPLDTINLTTTIPNLCKDKLYLEKQLDRIVYKKMHDNLCSEVFDAQTGITISEFSKEDCDQLIKKYNCGNIKSTKKINELDQWIPWSHYEELLPAYKFYMDDENHSVFYISSKTGEVIQKTTRKTRWLARFGAIPHWIYFTVLRRHAAEWCNTIIIIASIGAIMCLSGLITGLIYFRKRKKRNGKSKLVSPYKKNVYKWHHITGLIFGFFAFTFVLSGLFSLADVPQFISKNEYKINPVTTWNSINNKDTINKIIRNQLQLVIKNKEFKRVCFNYSMNKNVFFLYKSSFKTADKIFIQKEDTLIEQNEFSFDQINKRAQNLFSNKNISITLKTSYDTYYNKSKYHSLPVYELKFNNRTNGILYVDKTTGQAESYINTNSRIHYWLYQALHSFKFPFLNKQEWLRKLLLIIFSSGGLILSMSGILIIIKRYGLKK